MRHECIPKKKLPKRKNLPWLSKKLINLIKRRNLLYKRAKLTGNFTKYKAIRNRVASELQFAKGSLPSEIESQEFEGFLESDEVFEQKEIHYPYTRG